MATGTITLLWYVCCLAFVAFTVAIGAGLFVYGERKRRRLAAAKGPPAEGGAEAPLDPPVPPH